MSTEKPEGYEKTDLSYRAVVTVWISMLVVCVGVFLVSGYFIRMLTHGPVSAPEAPSTHVPPRPWLEVNETIDLAELHRREDVILNSYGWVDKKHGVVRLPIDRAMDVLVKR
jgi:hypothetical protein